jgi:hypothetical protein
MRDGPNYMRDGPSSLIRYYQWLMHALTTCARLPARPVRYAWHGCQITNQSSYLHSASAAWVAPLPFLRVWRLDSFPSILLRDPGKRVAGRAVRALRHTTLPVRTVTWSADHLQYRTWSGRRQIICIRLDSEPERDPLIRIGTNQSLSSYSYLLWPIPNSLFPNHVQPTEG